MKSHWDIFISHASQNKDIADNLCGTFEASSASCWIAPRNIDPGRDYGEEIVRGIQDSTMFVVVFSAQANGSKHVLREVDLALSFDKIVVPIKIDASSPTGGMDYRLRTFQWVEAGGIPIPDRIIGDTLTVLNAAKQRDSTQATTPEYIILNVCSRCGSQYAEHDPSGCSFHPQPPQNIGHTGPRRDYAEIWEFPCCGQKYVGTFYGRVGRTKDELPPKSPGCVKGKHTPKYTF